MENSNLQKIADNHYREAHGFFYEDLVVGLTIEHRPGRTITMTDNIWQSLISLNQSPLHIDAEYAKQTEFKKILVSSLVTFNVINGMTVNTISYNAIANLGWNNVVLKHPVFIGDTLYSESTVIAKRESKSRDHQGIVTIKTLGKNQHDQVVITLERTILIPKKNIQSDNSKTEGVCQ